MTEFIESLEPLTNCQAMFSWFVFFVGGLALGFSLWYKQSK